MFRDVEDEKGEKKGEVMVAKRKKNVERSGRGLINNGGEQYKANLA